METTRTDRQALYRGAIEAMLLAAPEALDAATLAAAIGRVTGETVEVGEIEQAVVSIQARQAGQCAGVRIEKWAGGYRLATHPDFAAFVEAAEVQEKPLRLSGALLETLAVVAYNQPVTRPELDFVRGVDSGYAIGRLAELGLVEITGRSENVGKPLLYATTPYFLEAFGLSGLDALPTLREIEEVLADPAFSRERARMLTFRDMQVEQAEASPILSEPDDEAAPPLQ